MQENIPMLEVSEYTRCISQAMQWLKLQRMAGMKLSSYISNT